MRRVFVASVGCSAATLYANSSSCQGAAPLAVWCASQQARGTASSASVKALKWSDLPSDPAAFQQFAAEAFSQNTAAGGAEFIFSDVLGLDEALLDMIPSDCVGVILCHPCDPRISQLKEKKALESASSAVAPSLFFARASTLGSTNGGCGPLAIANVLGNAAAAQSSGAAGGENDFIIPTVIKNALLADNGSEESASAVQTLHKANERAAKNGPASSSLSATTHHFTALVPAVADKSLAIVELDSLRNKPIVWNIVGLPATANKSRTFLSGSAAVLQQYFNTVPNSIAFSAIAVSVAPKK